MTVLQVIPTSSAPEIAVKLHLIGKKYGEFVAVEGLNLAVKKGEIVALLGASGSGKTTTLRLIAGLEIPDWGEVHLNGKKVSTPTSQIHPNKRQLSMVFQDLALWPHMNAYQHLDFVLAGAGYSRKQRRELIEETLSRVKMGKKKSYPHQLSGGEQQRLALARALVIQPEILLMDEPFSSLDQGLKSTLLAEVKNMIQVMKTTVIYVTHQITEAIYLADSVAVMAAGKIARHVPVKQFESEMHSDRLYNKELQQKTLFHTLNP